MINRDDSIIFRNPSSNVRASFSNETKDEQNNGEGEKKKERGRRRSRRNVGRNVGVGSTTDGVITPG